MSVDHKRPLFAFAIVAIACAVIIVNGIRSEAFVAIMRTGASHIVAGMVLEPVRHRPQHTTAVAPGPTSVDRSSAPSAPPAPPASVVSRQPVVSRSGGRQATVTTGHPSSGQHASGNHAPGGQDHASGHERGHHDGSEHGRDHGRQHENQGRSHGWGHRQDERSQGHGRGHGYGYGRGDRGHDRQAGHSASAGRAHEGHDRRD